MALSAFCALSTFSAAVIFAVVPGTAWDAMAAMMALTAVANVVLAVRCYRIAGLADSQP